MQQSEEEYCLCGLRLALIERWRQQDEVIKRIAKCLHCSLDGLDEIVILIDTLQATIDSLAAEVATYDSGLEEERLG